MKKVALVTGGAKGIGAAIVKRLCKEGYSVAINYNTSEQRALSLCSFCASEGYTVLPVRCDVSDSSDVGRMFAEIEEKLGFPCMIVDACDISVSVLGKSKGLTLSDDTLAEIVRDNPAGQGDECTPIILVRPVKEAE